MKLKSHLEVLAPPPQLFVLVVEIIPGPSKYPVLSYSHGGLIPSSTVLLLDNLPLLTSLGLSLFYPAPHQVHDGIGKR